jgi:hypothetical protein
MLIAKNWMGTGYEMHELTWGEFASRYTIDSKECYKSKEASHEYERIKFQRYISKNG